MHGAAVTRPAILAASSSGRRLLLTTRRCPAERSIHCRSVGEQESQTSRLRLERLLLSYGG